MALARTEHRIEQSDTVADAHSDDGDDDDSDDIGADVGVWENVSVLCDCELFSSSSGSSGFSLLPGVSGSLGSVPEPLPPTSPPPPGGQKGHIHVGPCIPNPPVPPFHQLPPGPTIMTAAEMVNLLPSLLVSILKEISGAFAPSKSYRDLHWGSYGRWRRNRGQAFNCCFAVRQSHVTNNEGSLGVRRDIKSIRH